MFMAVIPIAQVQADRDVVGHLVDASGQAGDDRVEHLRAACHARLEAPELHGDIPLQGHVIMRDRRQQSAQVAEHRLRVGAEQRLSLLGGDVRADRGERCGVLHLEAHPPGDNRLAPQRDERGIRLEVYPGIAGIRPGNIRRIDFLCQPYLRHLVWLRRIVVREGRDKEWGIEELLQLEGDPVAAFPGLAIRDAAQAGRNPRHYLAHHRLCIRQVDAAIEVNVRGRHGAGSFLIATVRLRPLTCVQDRIPSCM